MNLRPITLVGIIVSIVTGLTLGVAFHLATRDHTTSKPAATLSEALRQVSHSYVEDVSEEELLQFAIEGMMRGLDDHSNYLNSPEFDALEATTTGRFGGIGIELGLVEGYFTVVSPIDDTPADRAGLAAGDRITELEGESVKGWLLTDIVKKLRGEPGSTVNMGVYRESSDESLDFDIERAVIEVASVKSRVLEPGIGYVRISQFQTTTGDDLEAALTKLTSSADGDLQGLVLDLRNNPGGTLHSSVEVVDHFLEQGLIVYTEGRLKSSYAKYRATRGDLIAGQPIVVLINGGSASASEIVAGALQDHGRAQLLGSRSYGKGSVQSVLPLNAQQALKLTTAYYFTPNGRSIHETGIEPDIAFDGDEDSLLAKAVSVLKGDSSDLAQIEVPGSH